jgi:hypothetical protein
MWAVSDFSATSFKDKLLQSGIPDLPLGLKARGFHGTITNISHTFHGYIFSTDKGYVIAIVQACLDAILFCEDKSVVLRHPNCYLHNKTLEVVESFNSVFPDTSLIPPSTAPLQVALLSGSQAHLAHYLWNHLSGLNRIIYSSRLPDNLTVYIVNKSQQYGKIADIFPEIAGDIRHLESDFASTPKYFNEAVIEPSDNDSIPLSLRIRIMKANSIPLIMMGPTYGQAQEALYVVIGPRFTGRKLINRLSCYETLFKEMKSFGIDKAVIVLDVCSKVDSRSGHGISFSEVDQLSDQIRSILRTNDLTYEVEIIYDLPLPDTLDLLGRSSFGFYEWGAGLAKMNWLMGKPCIVSAPTSALDHFASSFISRHTWGSYLWEAMMTTPYLVSSDDQQVSDTKKLNQYESDDYSANLESMRVSVRRCIEQCVAGLHLGQQA